MRILVTLLLFCCLVYPNYGQDTFSIVAVDSATGEVGCAGASCIDNTQTPGGVSIIGRVHPGRGAINTQSFWDPTNQNNASGLMTSGQSPTQIVNWLALNDVNNDPLIRQYGVADFGPNNSPRAAAYTGTNCFDWKGEIVGPNYSIQGNILLGPEVLDSMEARFLNTPGSLPEKLMAALQGANIPGADSRCLNEGVSSRSAFLKVAKTSDSPNNLWLDIQVIQTPFGVEPIDSLQTLYDEWQITGISELTQINTLQVAVLSFPLERSVQLEWEAIPQMNYLLEIYSLEGRKVVETQVHNGVYRLPANSLSAGAYTYRVSGNKHPLANGKLILP